MKTGKIAATASMTVFSWLMVMVVTAQGIGFYRSPGILSGMALAVTVILALPIKFIYQNFETLDESLEEYYSQNRTAILLTALIALPGYLSFILNLDFPLSGLINLSFNMSAQVFLPVETFYSDFSSSLGEILFSGSRLYLHLLWVYFLTGLAVSGSSKLKSKIPFPSDLDASVIPFTGRNAEIEIYIVTGMHGLVKIPESFCKECHMFVRAAQEAAEEVDQEVDISVRSYWTRFLRPLLKGGTHPPVILVNGELLAQGYDVPEAEDIVEKLEEGKI